MEYRAHASGAVFRLGRPDFALANGMTVSRAPASTRVADGAGQATVPGGSGELESVFSRAGACQASSPAVPVPLSQATDCDDRSTVFSRDGELITAFTFDEELRGDAAEEISRLRARGLEIELLSGDSEERTQRVAAQLGLPAGNAFGGLQPEEKSARVRELDRSDSLMIGDGLNDAAGLGEAFVAGTPAIDHPSLPARADFYFLGEGISAVRLVLSGAARLHTVVRTNLAVAVAYNALALALCFTGRVSPVSAAILMPISSIGLVLLTVYRMKGREASWTS